MLMLPFLRASVYSFQGTSFIIPDKAGNIEPHYTKFGGRVVKSA